MGFYLNKNNKMFYNFDFCKITFTLLLLSMLALQGSSRRRDKQQKTRKREMLHSTEQALVIANKKLIKKDWCKTREVRQQVQTEDGLCKGKINNRFCYGQCNSFYIPSDVVVSNGKGVIDTMASTTSTSAHAPSACHTSTSTSPSA